MTLENGKTLTESKGEVIYGASFLEWFANQAENTHGEVVPVANPNWRILTFKQPVGVAAALAPWNCECYPHRSGRVFHGTLTALLVQSQSR